VKNHSYTDAYLNTATVTTDTPGYQFNSTIALTTKALSNRYAAKAGS
jgi:hypothetical protein